MHFKEEDDFFNNVFYKHILLKLSHQKKLPQVVNQDMAHQQRGRKDSISNGNTGAALVSLDRSQPAKNYTLNLYNSQKRSYKLNAYNSSSLKVSGPDEDKPNQTSSSQDKGDKTNRAGDLTEQQL